MDLSIIIVNYNVKDFLHHLLQSIKAATTAIKAEVIIVDNASTDGSQAMLRSEFPDVTLIESHENLGFSKANNLGIKNSSGRYILLLNPDTLVNEDTFVEMITFMDSHEDVGMAGCKLLNPDGTLQDGCRRSFPGPWVSFCKVTGLSVLFPKSKLFARYNLSYLDENETYEVDAISGAFTMIRRSVVDEIGGLDETFFMYGEDLDWCYRVQKAGHKVYYVHTSKIIHYKGESTKRSNIDETRVFYNAMRIFVRKHFSSYIIIEWLLRFAISIREILAFAAKWKLVVAALFLDGFFFNVALYLAAHVYEYIVHWHGFDAEALPIVYTVPALIQIVGGMLAGAYNKERLQILRTVFSVAISFFLLSSVIYFTKDFAYSRAVLLMTYVGGLILLTGWRVVAKLFFRIGNTISGTGARKVFIIGTDETALKIAAQLKAKQTQYYKVIGFISEHTSEIGQTVQGVKVVGTLSNIAKMIREFSIDEVIFTVGSMPYATITEHVAQLQNEDVEFKIAGSNLDVLVGKRNVALMDDISLVDLTYNISQPGNRFAKRMFDIFVGMFLLLILPLATMFSGALRKSTMFKKMRSQIPACIIGRMSLVGPKPSYSEHVSLGKPGITGYWFTENEPEESFKKLDVFYGKNQSIWLDVEILTRTLMILLKGN